MEKHTTTESFKNELQFYKDLILYEYYEKGLKGEIKIIHKYF